jgi:hypothetical protein
VEYLINKTLVLVAQPTVNSFSEKLDMPSKPWLPFPQPVKLPEPHATLSVIHLRGYRLRRATSMLFLQVGDLGLAIIVIVAIAAYMYMQRSKKKPE